MFHNHKSSWQFSYGAAKVAVLFWFLFFFFYLFFFGLFCFLFPQQSTFFFSPRSGLLHAVMSSVFEANWKMVRKLGRE